MKEQAVLLGKASSLVGILTDPPEARRDDALPAVIFLNAGFIHRVGPNRLYVNLARDLAAMGFMVLRLDFSGIGDSSVRSGPIVFSKMLIEETQEAMDYLHAARGAERFILAGLCSGARVSFQVACCDPRVVGVVLLNPRLHLHDTTDAALNAQIESRTQARHYQRMALSSSFKKKKWWRAITGKANYRRLVRSMMDFRPKDLFEHRRNRALAEEAVLADFRALHERGVRLLHVYSEGDTGLDYFHLMLGHEVKKWIDHGLISVEVIPVANHTFTPLWSQEQLLNIVRRWVQESGRTVAVSVD